MDSSIDVIKKTLSSSNLISYDTIDLIIDTLPLLNETIRFDETGTKLIRRYDANEIVENQKIAIFSNKVKPYWWHPRVHGTRVIKYGGDWMKNGSHTIISKRGRAKQLFNTLINQIQESPCSDVTYSKIKKEGFILERSMPHVKRLELVFDEHAAGWQYVW